MVVVRYSSELGKGVRVYHWRKFNYLITALKSLPVSPLSPLHMVYWFTIRDNADIYFFFQYIFRLLLISTVRWEISSTKTVMKMIGKQYRFPAPGKWFYVQRFNIRCFMACTNIFEWPQFTDSILHAGYVTGGGGYWSRYVLILRVCWFVVTLSGDFLFLFFFSGYLPLKLRVDIWVVKRLVC